MHRDIKGGNILVEKSGRIKLADFGMAKQMVEKMSLTRSFKGSAFWMAPEVIAMSAFPPSVYSTPVPPSPPRLLTRPHRVLYARTSLAQGETARSFSRRILVDGLDTLVCNG